MKLRFLRYALFQRVAGSNTGADDRFRAGHQWAVLPSAHDRYVDRRVCGTW